MVLDALLITSISLCTVSDSDRFQDGNGMLDCWTRRQSPGLSCEEQGDGRSVLLPQYFASESVARLVTQRRRKRSPGAAPRQVLPSGERNRSDPHITPGLSDNVEPS